MSGRKRHPIRGAISGLVLGIGVGILLVVYAKLPWGAVTPIVPVAGFFVLGLLLGLVGPTTSTGGRREAQ